MALSDWFGTVQLENPRPAQRFFLTELEQMLAIYQPSLLNKLSSSIRDEGHAWTKASTIEVRLVHATEPEGAIEIGLSPDEAIISWFTAHDHITERDGMGIGRGRGSRWMLLPLFFEVTTKSKTPIEAVDSRRRG